MIWVLGYFLVVAAGIGITFGMYPNDDDCQTMGIITSLLWIFVPFALLGAVLGSIINKVFKL